MAALATQVLVDAGTAPTLAVPNASDTAEVGNGINTFLVVRNSNAATRTVTITAPGNTTYGQPAPDPVLTIAALTGELWIPLRKAYQDDAVAGVGRCTVTVSVAAGVTYGVVQVG